MKYKPVVGKDVRLRGKESRGNEEREKYDGSQCVRFSLRSRHFYIKQVGGG